MRFAVNSCLLQFSVIHRITYTNVRGGSIVFEMKSGGKVGVFRADVRVNRCNFELSQGEMPQKSLYKPCARAFNRSRATQAVAPDISKAFDRVWHAGLLHKLKSYGISGQMFGLISSFLSNRQLLVVLNGKSSQ